MAESPYEAPDMSECDYDRAHRVRLAGDDEASELGDDLLGGFRALEDE